MERRAGHLAIACVLLAACAGSAGGPTAAPASDLPPTSPPVATDTPIPSPTGEPLSVVWISDSTAMGGVAAAYGRRIEADLGVPVDVHSFWSGGLTVKGALNYLRGTSNGGILATADGKVKIADFIPDADIVVVSGQPAGSDTAEHPWDWDCDPYYNENPSCLRTSVCGPETWQQYEADVVAIFDEIFKLRDGRPVILRTHDRYLPWGPLATWTACDCVDICVRCWHEWSDAHHRAAAARNVPVAGYYAAFSGPAGDQPLPSAWISNDGLGVHPSGPGAEALAGIMADLGYDPVAPPGG
jgi:hypothetical protein